MTHILGGNVDRERLAFKLTKTICRTDLMTHILGGNVDRERLAFFNRPKLTQKLIT